MLKLRLKSKSRLNNRGFAPIVILILIAGAVLSAGAFYMGRRTGPQQPITLSLPSSSATFQDLLSKKCRSIDVVGKDGQTIGTVDGISMEDLLVKIDESIIKVKFQEEDTVSCLFGQKGKQFVSIEYNDGDKLYIYDKNSEELGHGGPPFLGSFGEKIDAKDGIQLGVYLGWPEAGDALPGEIPVIARGEKKIVLKNGDIIFANTSKVVIKEDDPRLVGLLNERMKPSSKSPTGKELEYAGTDKVVASHFFALREKWESPEKDELKSIEETLNAVTIK